MSPQTATDHTKWPFPMQVVLHVPINVIALCHSVYRKRAQHSQHVVVEAGCIPLCASAAQQSTTASQQPFVNTVNRQSRVDSNNKTPFPLQLNVKPRTAPTQPGKHACSTAVMEKNPTQPKPVRKITWTAKNAQQYTLCR